MVRLRDQPLAEQIKSLKLTRLAFFIGSFLSIVVVLYIARGTRNAEERNVLNLLAAVFAVIGVIEYLVITAMLNRRQAKLDAEKSS